MTFTQDVGGNSPWLQHLRESLEMIGSMPWGHTCPDLQWQPSKEKNVGMLAGVTDFRRSQKWGCRGRLALGFKPRHGSHTGGEPPTLAEWGPRGFGVLPFATWLRKQERLCLEEKG